MKSNGRLIFIPLATAILLAVAGTLWGQTGYSKLSPFSGMRWKADAPEVEVEDVWYELLEINGIGSPDLVAFCKTQYARKWRKRFEEDLVQALTEMGHKPGTTAGLKLRRIDSGEEVTLSDVPMTRENRQRILAARRRRESADSREEKRALTGREANKDIRQLLSLLENNHSYLTLRPFDYGRELKALRKRAAKSISQDAFALELRKIIAGFGDGHSRVRGWLGFTPPGYTPFVMDEVVGRLVALQSNRSGLLDPEYPYVGAIDGLPVQRWLEAASVLVAKGSPQFVRMGSIEVLHCIQFVRGELGRDRTERIELTLHAGEGEKTRSLTLRVAGRPPLFSPRPAASRHGILDGNVGYLRISKMDDGPEFLASLVQAMNDFHETEGLIIDVRGNGGGSRSALVTLFPFFMKSGDPPHVANAAKYRLRPGDARDRKEGYLQNRFLYPATSDRWSDEERSEIRRFARRFEPQWEPSRGDFSNWHYMVLSPSTESGRYHYGRPVVVLQDRRCFSATDIFIAAFKGWRNVTLMGTPTGGGSGRSEQYTLEHSGLRVKLSTMASFQPTGRLYDGNGVEPDIVAAATLVDMVGKTDSLLEKAKALVKKN